MQLCRNMYIGNQKQGKIRLVGTEGNAHETQLRAHTALAGGGGEDGAEARSPNADLISRLGRSIGAVTEEPVNRRPRRRQSGARTPPPLTMNATTVP